jgi:hypothetical protein
LRYEGEVMMAIFGGDIVSAMLSQFDRDILPAVAQRVTRAEDIILPAPFLNGIGETLFWDHL